MIKKLKRRLARAIYDRNIQYRNIEGNEKYNFTLVRGKKPVGTSVMLRAKNEESKIGLALRSIYEAFDQIVVIDNGSTDKTADVVNAVIEEIDREKKIHLVSYPFSVARCGDEHGNTVENSVHSLVYYYNWCLSLLKYNIAVKWDADMYLKQECIGRFKEFFASVQTSEALLLIPIQTVYIALNGECWEADGEVNAEFTAFSNRPYIRYKKAQLWEALETDIFVPKVAYPNVDVYEIKDCREDEFSHWSTTEFTTPRKQQEWENYNKVKEGELDSGFSKIDASFMR